MFVTSYSRKALQSLKKIPKKYQKKVLKVIDSLKEAPFYGKKLQGELCGLYSIRIWPYRIIYLVKKEDLIIVIVDIGHRQNIYKWYFRIDLLLRIW